MTTTSTAGVSTSSGASYITSTASGLDTDSLIEAAVAQKTARADTIDAKVTANEAKIAAYEEIQTLVAAVSDAIEGLALPNYSSLGSENSFDSRSAALASSSGDTVTGLAVDVTSDAINGDYEIEVQQLAQAMKVSASSGSSTDAIGVEGVLSLGVDGGESVEITVTATTTLSDLAKAINAQSDTTGVQASLIQLDSSTVQLVLSASDTNQTIVLSTVSGDDVALAIGLTDDTGAFANVLREAQPSIITVDGATVTRDTNELTDVIDGVSLSLSGVTDGAVTLTVSTDSSAVKTAITDFVDAYNALKQYILDQSAVSSDGGADEDAVLFADSVMRMLNSTLQTLINTGSAAASDDITMFSDMGITWTSDGLLELSDETALNDAILSNLDDLESFFETDFSTSDSNLKLLANDTTSSLAFTLTITTDETGAITAVSADGDSAAFTVSGSRLVGAEGSIYEGISFTLSPATSGDISVSIQQGFANMLAKTLEQFDDSSSSLIQQRIDSLTDINTDLSDRSDKIRDDAETYRTKLVTKYANMEAELEAARLLQEQIEAILGSSDDDE
ncbi:flagellar filament capping protein FliD [Brevundimonas sp. SL130]|uniref:flagellar filament capping protein FliD n=1 Tax=Brevundimonas sp. SL130 TaxID=2995143 RepID=UPI00226CE033|nr:flagellar filament capping protein FliD [Brevundimonas sp. SL130]WAC60692.1 flagellar filament capping protein FliD [Brevundimonas sp. SL130]